MQGGRFCGLQFKTRWMRTGIRKKIYKNKKKLVFFIIFSVPFL